MQLYLDMDGVLADFDKHYEDTFKEPAPKKSPTAKMTSKQWKLIHDTPDFFYGIPPLPDMQQLWGHCEIYNPIVLTGIPNVKTVREAASNKREWIDKHLGPRVPVICTQSHLKYMHCKPGDVLIDDWVKYKDLWTGAGGIWITHTSARNSIKKLQEILDS